jgi:hypothetical protein
MLAWRGVSRRTPMPVPGGARFVLCERKLVVRVETRWICLKKGPLSTSKNSGTSPDLRFPALPGRTKNRLRLARPEFIEVPP